MNACLNGSQAVVVEPATSVLPGNIRNANSRATPRPTESELYRWGPEIWALTSLLDDSNTQANLRTTVSTNILASIHIITIGYPFMHQA